MKKHLGITILKEHLRGVWKYLSNVNKFGGLFILTVSAGVVATVVGGLILNHITSKPDNDIPIDVHSNAVADDTVPDDDNVGFESITSEDTTLDSIVSNENISNGTIPKRTVPYDIPISEEMKEKLLYIQKLSIGSNKDWVDDKLGTPFAENVRVYILL